MTKITKNKKKENRLLNFYNDLNEKNKIKFRTEFLKNFEHRSTNTFYMKLRQETQIKTIEKEFIAEYFKTDINNLFN